MLADVSPQSAITLNRARIVNAQESLSVPARFVAQEENGKEWSIVTNQYHHLGAATEGDIVSVRGNAGDATAILLTSPESHHIYIPTLS
jgi:hypothetical protein